MDIDKEDATIPIIYRMRGYRVEKKEQCVFSVAKPGSYVVENREFDGAVECVLGESDCRVC